MFTGPIFNDPIFANAGSSSIDYNIQASLTFKNRISSELTPICVGMSCLNFNHGCAQGRYKRAQNHGSRAYVAAITICNQKLYFIDD
jgi:hypothetical protein